MKYKGMSSRDREICIVAYGYLQAQSRVPGERPPFLIHGDDKDGNIDLEFRNVWAAVDWATAYGVRACVELRDPKRLTDVGVLTFNLYDFAKRRAQLGHALAAEHVRYFR